MSFNIGLSGLYAANKQLDVTGNNIANVATTGFKSSRAEFADVYSANKLGVGTNNIGNGVRLAAVSQQFTNGDITNTGNVLDMGIQGQGFFVLSDNGALSYTRAGAFQTNKDNYVVTADGLRLRGYGVDENGKIINGVLTDLKIDTSALAPKSTTAIDQGLNLNSSDKVIPATTTFSPTDENSWNKTFATKIYDSQGNEHVMDQYYVKTGTNTWKSYTLIDGRNPLNPAEEPPKALEGTIVFNSDGSVKSMTAGAAGSGYEVVNKVFKLTGWIPAEVTNASAKPPVWGSNGSAANAGGIAIDMTDTTSYNTPTTRLSQSQDGYATGILSSLSIDSSGVMFASFSNQQSRAIGQVAIASFANEQGLQPMGGTRWTETYSSGIPGIDAPKTGTLGAIASNSLEASNVNLTNELVELIKAQSNYQANAKTISTQSTIMQTIIQMA
ncbi:flagellar hook protein FlgE [Pseudomonas sp. NPDC087612]|uniref:Flagellar hook protein FlgE n=1 Tax=Pseudomonas vranovensis TaxID=321661 RepID=A0A423CUA7_9PSED|nr:MULTISPECIES: flagellar hook protein FlgE [Pseudomonas]KJK15687.1 flagellar hook protein FlgE [Pseudomonas sp. 2(2015)]NLU59821.1 flagellar hook protein FlgE [Pseudomonas sp. BIGb0427]QPG60774.1 flagellar hook protein FlgE [Pseudomonas sp. BIGb0427]QVM95310.1 flagellar hook protein FlgE [Pseudomonas sp. SORT22]ROL62828.1 flagellar hook protein FlgE [Pseudomonas vranovensis]